MSGNGSIAEMQSNSQFLRITGAGLHEGPVHDVDIMREVPNHRQNL